MSNRRPIVMRLIELEDLNSQGIEAGDLLYAVREKTDWAAVAKECNHGFHQDLGGATTCASSLSFGNQRYRCLAVHVLEWEDVA